MMWSADAPYNMVGHEHDPMNPKGCPGCKSRHDEWQQANIDERGLEQATGLILSRLITHEYKSGLLSLKNKDYQSAKSFFSRCLLQVVKNFDNDKTFDKNNEMVVTSLNLCICTLLLHCSDCNWSLKHYMPCMRDLNEVVVICRQLIVNKPSHNYFIPIVLIPIVRKAMVKRAKLFKYMGNSFRSLSDYLSIETDLFCNKYCNNCTHLVSMKHPNKKSLVKCNSKRKRMMKFSKHNGWIQITPKNQSKKLPTKYGHYMFEYKNTLYIFGGGNYHESSRHSKPPQQHYFIEINLNMIHNQQKYSFKPLPIPSNIIKTLFGINKINEEVDCAQFLATIKWKHFMIVFGGNNYPFKRIVRFNLKNKRWETVKLKLSNNFVCKQLLKIKRVLHHSLILMNNKMYCFGGSCTSNLLTCFDLISNKWCILSHSITNPRTKGINNLPEDRFDHFMFCDPNKNSIYIGFGHYHRFEAKHMLTDPQRHDIWRFDVTQKKWFRNEILNGNVPCERAESAYCSNDKAFYLFGGYNSGIPSKLKGHAIGCYNYLADFFEFEFKTQSWKIIQSNVFPSHRTNASICYLKNANCILLYGGVESSVQDTTIFDDLWLLDLNELDTNKLNSKQVKYCDACGKSNAQRNLWKCNGICSDGANIIKVARYCSLKCQKWHWKHSHRKYCNVK